MSNLVWFGLGGWYPPGVQCIKGMAGLRKVIKYDTCLSQDPYMTKTITPPPIPPIYSPNLSFLTIHIKDSMKFINILTEDSIKLFDPSVHGSKQQKQ